MNHLTSVRLIMTKGKIVSSMVLTSGHGEVEGMDSKT